MIETEPAQVQPAPNSARRERDILRTFRGAGITRIRREGSTQTKLEAELRQADEELQRTLAEAKANKIAQEADSLKRYEVERHAAGALLTQTHADADAKLRQSESSLQGYYQGQHQVADSTLKQVRDAAQARLDSESRQAMQQHQAADSASRTYFEKGKNQAAAHLAVVETALTHAQARLSSTKFASLLPQLIAPLQPQHPAYQAQNPLAALATNEQTAAAAAQEIDRALVDLANWQKIRNRLIVASIVLLGIAATLIIIILFVQRTQY